MHGAKYMWITCVPLAWLIVVCFTAGYQKIFSPLPAVGFLAQADKLEAALRSGAVSGALAGQTSTLIFNARLDAALCGLFLVLVATILIDSVRIWAGVLRGTRTADVSESPFVLSTLRAEEV
jgi:carbon starvation protein